MSDFLNFNKGDILKAIKMKGFHPIIYLNGYTTDDFIGAIITHSSGFDNKKMCPNHFEEGSEIIYKPEKPSYLVLRRLIKPVKKWGPYIKIGSLTTDGLDFLESNIDPHKYITWEQHMDQLNKEKG